MKYRVEDPKSGRSLVMDGDHPPTAAQIKAAFAAYDKRMQELGGGGAEARQAAVMERVEALKQVEAIKEQHAENVRVLEKRAAWDEAHAKGPSAAAALMIRELAPTAARMAAGMGIVGTAAAAGSLIGQRAGGSVGRKIGGAAGGAVGSTTQQLADMMFGDQTEFEPGEVLSTAIATGLISKGAKRNAVLNAGAEVVRSIIDQQELPDYESLSKAAAMGYFATKVANRVAGREILPIEHLYDQRNSAFAAVRGWGVRVNPMELDRGSAVLNAAAGGVQPIGHAISRANQGIWQQKALGVIGQKEAPRALRPTYFNRRGRPVKGDIDTAIEKFSKPYKEIRAISERMQKEIDDLNAGRSTGGAISKMAPDDITLVLEANKNLDLLKGARQQVSAAADKLKQPKPPPEAFQEMQAAKALEAQLEARIEQAAVASGKPKLVRDLKAARVRLSQVYAVRDATTNSSGLIDINHLAKIRQTPSRPGYMLTGDLAKMADMAENFSQSTLDAVSHQVAPPAGVALNYAVRQTMAGHVAGVLSATVPSVSRSALSAILSDFLQNKWAKPKYAYTVKPDTMLSLSGKNALMQLGRGESEEEERRPIPYR